MNLHSRAPIMSTINSSLKILSKICGLLSKTAREQTYSSYEQRNKWQQKDPTQNNVKSNTDWSLWLFWKSCEGLLCFLSLHKLWILPSASEKILAALYTQMRKRENIRYTSTKKIEFIEKVY